MGTSRYIGNYKEKKILEKCRKNKLCAKENGFKCEYIVEEAQCSESEYLPLNNIKYDTGSCRADCTLNKVKYVKVSGYVKNHCDIGVSGVVVSLLKQVIRNSGLTYINKGDAISDAIGYFQFVIYRDYDIDDYLVKISDGDILN